MLFNTMGFLIFFIIVFAVYHLLPHKVRNFWLLGASYYFYMQWNARYGLLLVFVTVVSYLGGIGIERYRQGLKQRNGILAVCLILCLGVLAVFKYFNFFIDISNRILNVFKAQPVTWYSRLVLPVGISFFTLQSIGYLMDVYKGKIDAEKNLFTYALFVSFFPQLVAGPIERSGNLIGQLKARRKFSFQNVRKGLVLMLWGLFVKMVIADNLALFVDKVYGNYTQYNGLYIILATIMFSIQIYCDFYGYSIIAKGAALNFGIRLMDNFDAPYLSKSVKEFWRRWHISLSSWFRDYLYIPLGGNRKGKTRSYVNLMIVFAVSGLWHGAGLNFVFWGLLNGAYQVVGSVVSSIPVKNPRMLAGATKVKDHLFVGILQRVRTFLLVGFAWLFFRAESIKCAFQMMKSAILGEKWHIFADGSVYKLGIDKPSFIMLLVALLLLLAVDHVKLKGNEPAEVFLRCPTAVRSMAECILVFAILMFGRYGGTYDVANFIYFRF